MKLEQMTFEEKLTLRLLLQGPRLDCDTIVDRVLINCDLAERCGIGCMKITDVGRKLATQIRL